MKPRHAAALALVGWYLMVPAPGNESAPLQYWSQLGSYDTAKACEQDRNQWYGMMERKGFALKNYQPEDVKRSWNASECIASDDPRLKEK